MSCVSNEIHFSAKIAIYPGLIDFGRFLDFFCTHEIDPKFDENYENQILFEVRWIISELQTHLETGVNVNPRL